MSLHHTGAITLWSHDQIEITESSLVATGGEFLWA